MTPMPIATIFNLGSINCDHYYLLPHLPKAGETIASSTYQQILGGKGANQSVALGKALNCSLNSDYKVTHIGGINAHDLALISPLKEAGVDLNSLKMKAGSTGHAIIAVDENTGENNIILHPGTNHQLTPEDYEPLLKEHANKANWALTQNETSYSVEFIKYAHRLGIKTCYAAAPFDAKKVKSLEGYINVMVLNQGEALELAELYQAKPEDILVLMGLDVFVITQGAEGADLYSQDGQIISMTGIKVSAIDTTGAGDTFLGFFLAKLCEGNNLEESLSIAIAASAIQVTRMGASVAIPTLQETLEFASANKHKQTNK